MVLHEFLPAPALEAYVRAYRVVYFVFEDITLIPFKPYPPKPEQCLSFYPHDTEKVEYTESGKKISGLKSVIMGQQSELTHRYVGRRFLVFQVVFRPGALYRLTAIPSQELTNCYIDAETLFRPAEIKEVNERLAETDDFTEMTGIVNRFLLKQAGRNCKEAHRADNLSHLVQQTNRPISMDQMAREACLSLRQLERTFMQRMGVSPKYFSKLVRFEHAYRMKNKYPQTDWLSIAIHCGYHDYQHLVKDYKTFTGQSPTSFHLLDLSAPERQFGEADTY